MHMHIHIHTVTYIYLTWAPARPPGRPHPTRPPGPGPCKVHIQTSLIIIGLWLFGSRMLKTWALDRSTLSGAAVRLRSGTSCGDFPCSRAGANAILSWSWNWSSELGPSAPKLTGGGGGVPPPPRVIDKGFVHQKITRSKTSFEGLCGTIWAPKVIQWSQKALFWTSGGGNFCSKSEMFGLCYGLVIYYVFE